MRGVYLLAAGIIHPENWDSQLIVIQLQKMPMEMVELNVSMEHKNSPNMNPINVWPVLVSPFDRYWLVYAGSTV